MRLHSPQGQKCEQSYQLKEGRDVVKIATKSHNVSRVDAKSYSISDIFHPFCLTRQGAGLNLAPNW